MLVMSSIIRFFSTNSKPVYRKKETSNEKNIIKGAFTVKKTPFPWERAIYAGICSAVPVLIGLLFGNFQVWSDRWNRRFFLSLRLE